MRKKIILKHSPKQERILKFQRMSVREDLVNLDFHLTIPSAKHADHEYLRNHLVKSGIFKTISVEPFSDYNRRLYKFKINDKVCVVDRSDVPVITSSFSDKYYNVLSDTDFVFVYQYSLSKRQIFKKTEEKFNVKILPLTYSTGPLFYEDADNWILNSVKKYISHMGFSTTRHREHRIKWIEEASKMNGFIFDKVYGKQYNDILNQCLWGLSIPGRGISYDAKCYREVEFMQKGMPLALGYKPCYPFPFYPNIDYLYLNDEKDLSKLIKAKASQISYYSNRSKENYKKYFSPEGVACLLIKILFDESYYKTILGFWENVNNVNIEEKGFLYNKMQLTNYNVNL